MNPIIRRELLEVLRTRRALALQLGIGLACALLVLVRWPTGDVTALGGARSLQVLRAAVLQITTLALLVSTLSQSSAGALRATYGLVLAVCVLTFAPHVLLQAGGDLYADLAGGLRCLSPIPAVLEVLGQGDVASQ